MASELINIGANPDDGAGDDAVSAGGKINRNALRHDAAIAALSGLNLVAGTVTKLAAGSNPTMSISGTAPNLALNLGLVDGGAGAGAPTSPDILAIAERDDLLRSIAAAGVPEQPNFITDFVRDVFWAKGAVMASSLPAMISGLVGSSYTRASSGTYWGSDGLLKTAASGSVRLHHDPVTRKRRGILLEPARTNSCLYSEDYTQARWTGAALNVSVIPAAAVAPNGLSVASSVVATTVNGFHSHMYNATELAKNQVWTWSLFIKSFGIYNRVRLQMNAFAGNGNVADFNLASGVVISANNNGTGSGAIGRIEPCGNGWYRVSLSGQPSSEAANTFQASVGIWNAEATTLSFAGDGASGLYVFGAQLEAGGGPSSYIPTTGSAAVRAADVGSVATAPWLNLQAGTIFAEFAADAPSAAGTNALVVDLGTGTLTDFIRFHRNVGGNGFLRSNSGGVNQFGSLVNLNWPVSRAPRGAIAWAANDAAWAWDGAVAGTANPYVVPAAMPWLRFVADLAPAVLARVFVHPQRLSNAKIQALTNLWS